MNHVLTKYGLHEAPSEAPLAVYSDVACALREKVGLLANESDLYLTTSRENKIVPSTITFNVFNLNASFRNSISELLMFVTTRPGAGPHH
jgi:hypothetical protein